MLTLTENASTIVRDITEQTPSRDDAGLRITTEPEEPPRSPRSPSASPRARSPGDATVEQDGAIVYLDASSAEQLDDKVLDAGLDPRGQRPVRPEPPGLGEKHTAAPDRACWALSGAIARSRHRQPVSASRCTHLDHGHPRRTSGHDH